MNRVCCATWILLLLSIPVQGADVKAPPNQRFRDSEGVEVPDFQRHVLPLMGRLGCNGRACHGSFQGQGGFRLSLFGYDFSADLESLTGGEHPRVDLESVDDSLILAKPTLAIPHKGGKRLDTKGWEYNILHRWIEAGAKGVAEEGPAFVRLEVTPHELVFEKPGESAQLRAIAHWSDGTAEDVTLLCRFRTNDESVVEIDENGLAKSLAKGDTHAVAFYDNGVAPTPVVLPVTALVGEKYPKVPAPTKIDELVIEKLRKLGIVPSDLAEDAEFLRRVSLDITGSLPSPDEVLSFLEDTSPEKRATKIDELLERPSYVAWWATLFCDITGTNPRQLQQNAIGNQSGQQAAEQWYAWIHRRIRENLPYDELVKGIVLASSRTSGQSYDDYVADMGSYFVKETDKRHKSFADRESMPYYWINNVIRNKPDEMALRFSHTFLGVRLQCAQCHKHPFDQWTQDDFKQFAAFFGRVRYGNNPEAAKRMAEIEKDSGLKELKNNQERQRRAQELLNEGKPLPWQELFVAKGSPAGRGQGGGRQTSGQRTITPKLLGGDEVVGELADPRNAILDWMLDPNNPYFARAIVNRVWTHYFGVGIIDPPDDLNLANPPSNAALIDYLAGAFVNHRYDLKWLHREITNSRTYQLTWKTNETNQLDTRNFSHATMRRLPAEVAYDAIVLATASTEQWKKLQNDPASRAIADQRSNARQGRGQQQQYALRVFGQPERASTCDCERSTEPSLSQSLYLMNDFELFTLLDRKEGLLAELSRSGDQAGGLQLKDGPGTELLRELFLRTLSRPPNEEELSRSQQYVSSSKDPVSGLRDVLWALINTKEFIVNH